MTPLRRRMIEDMTLAGLAPASQALYVKSVYRLTAHYRRSPDQLSEEEVRSYLPICSGCGIAVSPAEPSRPLITAFSSCTATRWIATGRCFLKKDSLTEAEALTPCAGR